MQEKNKICGLNGKSYFFYFKTSCWRVVWHVENIFRSKSLIPPSEGNCLCNLDCYAGVNFIVSITQ